MLPGFGWSTVGAEQNDPDTLNNLLFGHIEQTPSFNDLFQDVLPSTSSFGPADSMRDDDPAYMGNDSSSHVSFHDPDNTVQGERNGLVLADRTGESLHSSAR